MNKRIEIVKDALKWVNTLKYDTGEYVMGPEIHGDLKENIDALRECQVCALGGLFISHINLFNHVSSDILTQIEETSYIGCSNDIHNILDYFDKETLDYVESAFEGWIRLPYNFTLLVQKYPDPTDRVEYILRHLLENDGKFIPENCPEIN